MKITDAIGQFLEFRRPNTRRTYERALNDLFSFVASKKKTEAGAAIKRVNAQVAASFLSLTQRKTAPDGELVADNTLRVKYFALRSIFAHLTSLGLLESNPWVTVGRLMSSRQQTQKRPTALVPYEKVEELMSIPNVRTKEGVRDRAILALLFGCGLRRSELISLDVGDVMVSHEGTLYLELKRTKAGKRRQQPLPTWAGEPFSVLVSQRKSEGAQAEDPLFPFYYVEGGARNRLSAETLYRLFRGYCKQLGLKAAPHAARATAATKLIEQGYNDRDVALFLGHSSPQMVQVYDKRRRGIEENPGKKLKFTH